MTCPWGMRDGRVSYSPQPPVDEVQLTMPTNLRFAAATAATEPGLRRLLRENPLTGNILVSLEREPNAFLGAGISGDSFQLMLASGGEPRHVIASGGRFELTAWVNGQPQRIGYFGELRAEGGLRTRRQLLLGAYRKMREFHDAGNVRFYLTTIIEDNHPARRLLEAGLGDMPTYRPLETMVTFTIPTRLGARRLRRSHDVQKACSEQRPAIVERLARHGRRYQFQPVWEQDTLASANRCRGLAPADFLVVNSGHAVRACMALWDQRACKQTVIRGYAPKLARARPLLNLVAPFVGRPRLPAPGARLESAFLSHVAIDEDDGEVLVGLVAAACRDAVLRGIDYVMISFATRHPLATVIRKRFPVHDYVSMIYVVFWEDGRDEADSLDGRIPHPEVAIL